MKSAFSYFIQLPINFYRFGFLRPADQMASILENWGKKSRACFKSNNNWNPINLDLGVVGEDNQGPDPEKLFGIMKLKYYSTPYL